MKKIMTLAAMMALAAMMMLTSCKKEEAQQEEPNPNAEKILGAWNLQLENTFVVRIYTSAAGESSADTIPLSNEGSSIVYDFADNGVLTKITTTADGSTSESTSNYEVKGDQLKFDDIIHYIVVLDAENLTFEQRQHQDYRSGEQLDYIMHYSMGR